MSAKEELFSEYANSRSIGHLGNGHGKEGHNVSQSLDELFRNSNTVLSIPFLDTLSEIFETSRASPFTGLETTGFLKFITGDGFGLFKSLSSVTSIVGSLPIIKSIVGGRGR